MDEDWIDTAGAAALCGVSPAAFRSYVHKGMAPGPIAKFGRSPIYSRKAVLAWHDSRPGPGYWRKKLD